MCVHKYIYDGTMAQAFCTTLSRTRRKFQSIRSNEHRRTGLGEKKNTSLVIGPRHDIDDAFKFQRSEITKSIRKFVTRKTCIFSKTLAHTSTPVRYTYLYSSDNDAPE